MSYKKWIINEADKEKASHLSEQMNIDAFIAFLLVSRGVDNELTASEFLSDSSRFSSPYSFKDMDKAVKRINTALDEGEAFVFSVTMTATVLPLLHFFTLFCRLWAAMFRTISLTVLPTATV